MMFLDNALATHHAGTLEAVIKNAVDTSLFQGVKFYTTQKSASHVIGYVFNRMKLGGSTMDDKILLYQKLGCSMSIHFIQNK